MTDHSEKIKRIIGECSDLCAEEIATISLDDNLNAFDIDSLSMVEMIMMIENEFGIEIDVDDLAGDAVRLKNTKLTIGLLNETINAKLAND
jgi:acyl carrier protein